VPPIDRCREWKLDDLGVHRRHSDGWEWLGSLEGQGGDELPDDVYERFREAMREARGDSYEADALSTFRTTRGV